MRHVLACGPGRQVPDRSAGAGPVEVDYGSEYRYRNPIVAQNELAIVITQSGETADTLAALREAKRKGAQQHRHLQRRRQHGDARSRRHGLHARRAGDRRRLDQGVHVAARGAAAAGALHGAGARHAVAGRDAAPHRRAPAAAAVIEQAIQGVGGRWRRSRRGSTTARDFLFLGPRHQLPDRARGRAEAEGNLLHPRRGLPGRRDEARTDRAHRRATCRSWRSRPTTTSSRR